MCQADSNRAVAPRCRGGAFKHAEITPVLFLLVKECVFKGERFLCQLFMLRASGCACKPRQGPADTGYAMGKAAHSFRRVGLRPVSVAISMLRALTQQISKL